jgi:beta-catenin-like protein 1
VGAGKRKRTDDEAGEAEGGVAAGAGGARLKTDEATALERIEGDDEVGEDFDAAQLRRIALVLEKAARKNRQLRIKHSDLPTKFLESEVELHGAVQAFLVVSTAPELYEDLVQLGTMKTIVDLLGHENSDITVATIELIQELTSTEALEDEETNANLLIDHLLECSFAPMLVEILGRLTEPDDSSGVHQALAVVENVLELRPELADRFVAESELMSWLLIRLTGKKYKQFDTNKLYASELLSILLQNSDGNRLKLGQLDGVDRLLRALVKYKKHDPVGSEEIEMMVNLFNILCSSLALQENCKNFVAAEGIDLMILMLRSKNLSQYGALKVLDHAMAKGICPEIFTTFIERAGLKSLFPAFMKTPGGKKLKVFTETEFEEHICSIVASVFKYLEEGEHQNRLLKKFVESDYAKIERLVELHNLYLGKVQAVEESLAAEKAGIIGRGDEFDEIVENDHYLRRLDSGLSTLQQIALIIGFVCKQCGVEARDRFRQLLEIQRGSIDDVSAVLIEYDGELDLQDETAGVSKTTMASLIRSL